ncbi:hypothetical protein ACLBV4_07375, partial [Pseudomonas aeruginosa]
KRQGTLASHGHAAPASAHISLKAGIAMLGLDSGALPLGIDELLQRTEALLPDAYASGRIATCRLPALR